MRIYRGFPVQAAGPVALTIGNFDGVHRGHQAMLTRLVEAADDLRLSPALLTFYPHPREFFARGSAPPRLTTLRQKLDLLRQFGVATTFIARFDARLASLSPQAFIAQVLIERLRARWVLVGDDFRFGQGRAGDLALLRAQARTFSVEAMRPVTVAGERVSSSAIRDALRRGDLNRASELLGRPYAISGRVGHGDKLGRSLGFPTANIALAANPPLSGIFAVRVHGLDGPAELGGKARMGVASLGVRPTVKRDAKPLLEVFVFDFDETIYGRRVSVEFLRKLRDEEKYDDLTALTAQIRADVAQAREYFGATR
ncbi:MAG: bifunctional riboflavin kinase/FAD synthetase [Casimicrobiaceae bacterium]